MSKEISVEIPGNIELRLNKYERLMTLLYECGDEGAVPLLENVSKLIEQSINSNTEKNIDATIENPIVCREFLKELTAAFKELEITPMLILIKE